jgi:hypothetical protein
VLPTIIVEDGGDRGGTNIVNCGDAFFCCFSDPLPTVSLLSYVLFPFVAFRINLAVSSGYDTGDIWLEFIERVVAFIRSAYSRLMSGGKRRSF